MSQLLLAALIFPGGGCLVGCGGFIVGFLFVWVYFVCLFKIEWVSDNNLGIEFLLEQVIDEMLRIP